MGDWLIPVTTALIGAVAGAIVGPWFTKRLARRSASDRDQLAQWRVAFDRGAFQGPFGWHSDRTKHQKAIAETIKAINTGVMGSDANPHTQLGGKAKLRSRKLRETMEEVERLLRLVQSEAEAASPGSPIDEHRDQIIALMNAVWRDHKIEPVRLPTQFKSYTEIRQAE